MIPAFVIGLREGLEAALIVGIIAAFLARSGRRDALRPMWLGVLAAVGICLAVGIGLQVADEALPQRAAGGPRDHHRAGRGRRRHLDDRLVPAPRAAA